MEGKVFYCLHLWLRMYIFIMSIEYFDHMSAETNFMPLPGDRLVASLQIKGCFLYLYLASQTFTFLYCWIFTLHKYFTYYFYLFLGNGWSWWERCIRMKQKSVLPLQKVGRINLQDWIHFMTGIQCYPSPLFIESDIKIFRLE